MTDTKSILIELETSLFSPQVRASIPKLDELIAEDFTEIGASGIRFDKKHVLERLPFESPPQIVAMDFELRLLAPDCAQLLYRSVMERGEGEEPIFSHRCSLWRLEDSNWKMTFHQGTRCAEFEI